MEPITLNIPVLALRGLTVFPHMNLSFEVERLISIRALEHAMETDQKVFLVTQREIGVSAPQEQDLYEIGTVSRIPRSCGPPPPPSGLWRRARPGRG